MVENVVKSGDSHGSMLVDAIAGATMIGFAFGLAVVAIAPLIVEAWSYLQSGSPHGQGTAGLAGLPWPYAHMLLVYLAAAILAGTMTAFVLRRHILKPDDALLLGCIPGMAMALTFFVPVNLILAGLFSDVPFTFWVYMLALFSGISIFLPATSLSAFVYDRLTTDADAPQAEQATGTRAGAMFSNKKFMGLVATVVGVGLVIVIPLALAFSWHF